MKRTSRNKYVYYLLALFILSGSLTIISRLGLFKPVRSLSEKAIVIPVLNYFYQWQRNLKKDLGTTQLSNEETIAGMQLNINALTEENLKQKKLLSAPLPASWKYVTVKVISVRNEKLIISAGETGGVVAGMIATTDENNGSYIGRVDRVSQELAEVRLASFQDEKIDVVITPESEKDSIFGRGLLVGKGEGVARVEQILSNEKVKKDDLVGVIYRDKILLIGKLDEVTQETGDVFKTVKVKRLFNPETLTTIFLIRPQ